MASRAKDVLLSGHSLGGLGVNSVAELSASNWGGFFKDANYIAFASPTQSSTGNNVLNIGYENDPVFRVLDGTTFSSASMGKHDKPARFDHRQHRQLQRQLRVHRAEPGAVQHHQSAELVGPRLAGVCRWLESGDRFEVLQPDHKDSTIIVSNLEESSRGKTWVEDLGRSGEPHTGSTFIIGTAEQRLAQGRRG